MNKLRLANIIRAMLSIAILGVAAWLYFNRVYVIDQVAVWNYKPSQTMTDISAKSAMTDHAKFLFYASHPSIEPSNSFNTHCKNDSEKTAVLGCYMKRQIYLYDITDQRLTGIKEVTAAHEMLHAAYDRLPDAKKKTINTLIDEAASRNSSEALTKRLAAYEQTEPGERYNELHSILGTEATSLPDELERYYAEYFTNRLAVTAMYQRYEQVFTQLESQQKELVARLNELADSINRRSSSYGTAFSGLQRDISNFNARANAGSFSSESQFYQERAQLLSRQTTLSAERNAILAMIEEYDSKKTELDALAVQFGELQRSINSKSLPQVPNL